MEPEITTVNKEGHKKNILVIIFSVLFVFLVIAGGAFFLTKQKNARQAETQATVPAIVPIVQVEKVYTQAEKEQILAKLAESLPKSTSTPQERMRILEGLSKKIPTSKLSYEEKLRILQNIASSTKK